MLNFQGKMEEKVTLFFFFFFWNTACEPWTRKILFTTWILFLDFGVFRHFPLYLRYVLGRHKQLFSWSLVHEWYPLVNNEWLPWSLGGKKMVIWDWVLFKHQHTVATTTITHVSAQCLSSPISGYYSLSQGLIKKHAASVFINQSCW